MAGLKLRNLRKSFGNVEVIKGIDLEIEDGEFIVFVGPSGCGKSTLLRLIAGLEDITDGELSIGGRVVNFVEPKERGIAMVFQSYAIFPHMTVRENMAFSLTIAGAKKSEKEEKIAEAARILQMEDLLDRRPSQLSGGQRQRVAIGRAIVRNPSVFLFDEPLSNLDAALRVDMRMEISKLHEQLGATMIYVTHDQVEAMTLADRIVVLKDGTVHQVGEPMELYHQPANMFVAGFIGSPAMNFLDVVVQEVQGDRVTVANRAIHKLTVTGPGQGFTEGQALKLGVRPQYLVPSTLSDSQMKGRAVLSERLGTETVVDVQLVDGSRVIVAISEDVEIERDQEIGLTFDHDQVHLFPAPN